MKYGILVGLALVCGGCAVEEDYPATYHPCGYTWYSPWDRCIHSSCVFDRQMSRDRQEPGKVVRKMYDQSTQPSTTFSDSSSDFSESSDSKSRKSHDSSGGRDRGNSGEKREGGKR